MSEDLLTRVQTEADQCRNDGADDIARLLDEVAAALAPSAAEAHGEVLVTRSSAAQALNHLGLCVGFGRLAEATAMLVEAKLPDVQPKSTEPLHLGACLTDGKLHATVMRREPNGHITVMATAEIAESMLRAHDCHAVMTPAQAPAPAPWTTERHIALREAHQIVDSDAYFGARPALDGPEARDRFEAGHKRGFDAAAKLASQAPAVAHAPTEDELKAAASEYWVDDFLDFKAGVKFAERHYGIAGEGQPPVQPTGTEERS